MCPHTKNNLSTVDIDGRSGHGPKRIMRIDLTHPYLVTKRCIWLTRTLTCVHPDPFQALLTKQHTTKKPTHTNKVYDSHRVAHPPGLLGATPHLRFLASRFKREASCDASNAKPRVTLQMLRLWARPRFSEKSGPWTYGPIWSHKWWEMVPDTHLPKIHGLIGGEKWSQQLSKCRYLSTDVSTRSIDHGRCRPSIRKHLFENTVDNDGRCRFTYGELRSIVDEKST